MSQDDATPEETARPAKRGLARIFTVQKALLNIAAQQNTLVGGMLRGQVEAKSPTAGKLLGAAQQTADAWMAAQQRFLDQGLSMLGDLPETDTDLPGAEARARESLSEAMNTHRSLLDSARKQSIALTELADSSDPSTGNVAQAAQDALENFIDAQHTFLNAATDQANRAVNATAPTMARPELKAAADAGIEKFTEVQRRLLLLTQAYTTNEDVEEDEAEPGMGALAQKGVNRFIDAQHALLNLAQLALYTPPEEGP